MSNQEPKNFTIEDAKKVWHLSVAEIDDIRLSIKPSPELSNASTCNLTPSPTKITDSSSLTPDSDLQIIKILGKGGMGIVYRANQSSLSRNVAVKMLSAQFSENEKAYDKFVREAALTALLDHPNVVTVHDLGLDETGQIFYVMKEVKGSTWEDVIASKTLRENLDILLKVCDAVAFAHSKGVIHRDIKPENIMIGGFGEVILMDWGIAASISGKDSKAETLSNASSPCGTPAYMSPEMAVCDIPNIGIASDIYLLGGALFQIVTSLKPHTGQNVFECLHNAMNNKIQWTDKNLAIIDVAKKAMATNTAQRYASVRQFQRAIKDCIAHESSVKMAGIALQDLKEAIKAKNYDLFSQAIFGFTESLNLWPDNSLAKTELPKAIVAYAQNAASKGDYDLAISTLDRGIHSHMKMIVSFEKRRKIREKAFKALRFLSSAATICIVAELFLAYLVLFGSMQAPELVPFAEKKLASIIQNGNNKISLLDAKLKDTAKLRYDLYMESPLPVPKSEAQNNAETKSAYRDTTNLADLLIKYNMTQEATNVLGSLKDYPEKDWAFGRLKYLSSGQPFLEEYKLCGDLNISNVSADKTFSIFVVSAVEKRKDPLDDSSMMKIFWGKMITDVKDFPLLIAQSLGFQANNPVPVVNLKAQEKLRQEKKDAADTADPNSTPKDKDSPKTAEPSPLPSSTSGGPTLYLLRKGSKPEKLKMVEAYLSSISTSTAMGATTFIFKLSPDGEKIIFVNWTKSACKATTFSTSTQEKIWESDISQSVNSSNYYVASLVFSPDNQKIAFLGDTLPVIDLNTGKTISAYRWSEDKKLVAATFDSTSKKIIAILQKYEEGNDGRGNKWTRATNKVEMVEFDTSDGKILKTSNIEPPRSKYSGSAYQGNLRVSPNGMMFLIESSQFSMYPPGSLKPAYTISSYRTDSSSYSSSVQTVLNNNGKWLCGLEKKNLNAQNQNTNNSEYYLSVFNSATGEECIKWDCGKEAILGISFADDGRTIRTIDSNGGLKIYPAE